MSQSNHFTHGHLSISTAPIVPPVVLNADTPLLDISLAIAASGYRYVLIRDHSGEVAGVISTSDLDNILSTPGWETLTAESLVTTRLFGALGGRTRRNMVRPGEQLPCIPVLDQNELIAVMTPDDVFVSISRIESLIQAATIDVVTELANRRAFNRRLHEAWIRSIRTSEPLTLILLDVDHFKQINDSYGHLTGDAVLATVGAALARSLRTTDVIARFGGDEFAMLCFNCDVDNIAHPLNRVLEAVREIAFPTRDTVLDISVSIGAAACTRQFAASNPEALLNAADECLYHSKAAGRDCATYTHFIPGQRSDLHLFDDSRSNAVRR